MMEKAAKPSVAPPTRLPLPTSGTVAPISTGAPARTSPPGGNGVSAYAQTATKGDGKVAPTAAKTDAQRQPAQPGAATEAHSQARTIGAPTSSERGGQIAQQTRTLGLGSESKHATAPSPSSGVQAIMAQVKRGAGQPLVIGGDAKAATTGASARTAPGKPSVGGSPATTAHPPSASGRSLQPKAGPLRAVGVAPSADSSTSAAGGESAAIQVAAAPQRASAGGAVPPELPRMPAPASTLSSKELGRVRAVQGRAGTATTAIATARPAGENVALARAGVAVPQKESDAHAAQQVVAALAEREPPSPEILALCERIRTLIREKRPADEDEVIDTRPQEVAAQAGGQIEGDIKKSGDEVDATYGGINHTPAGPAPAAPQPIRPMPEHVATAPVNATAATPDAVPPAQVSLDADGAEMTAKAKDAGLEGETAQLVQSGPVADARAARGEMTALGKDGPAEALEQQKAALARADSEMAALQAEALASLQATRTGHVTSVKGQQDELKGGEEGLRAKLAAEATAIYEDARKRVESLLSSVHDVAMRKWSTRLPVISKRFNDDLKVVKDRIEERHSGLGGWFVSGWDAVTGLPGWVTDAYVRAEEHFGDDVCALIVEISSDVNTVIKTCGSIVTEADHRIGQIFTTNLPDGLHAWAAEQQRGFENKLGQLHTKAEATRANFNKELIENAGGAVQDAREKIQDLRNKARGAWGRFLDAVGAFLDNPFKFLIDGMLELVGISPRAFWSMLDKISKAVPEIARHPVRFASNLIEGVGAGFDRFFANFPKHLKDGFLKWLFNGLKGLGVEVPPDFSLKSMITFFLQLMGISWARIRKMLADVIGEKYVAAAEKALKLAEIIAKGPQGIVDFIKEKLAPEALLERVIQMATRYIMETLIKQVALYIIKLLNPVGAVLAAIEAIYKVLKWIFHNAARIFHFVEAVVNAVVAVVAGNIGVVAAGVEAGLAMLLPPVIDFFAEMIGLGDLPDQIAKIVKSLQAWVEEIIKSIIKLLAEAAKSLLASLGIGGKEDKGKKGATEEVGEAVSFGTEEESHSLFVKVSGTSATLMVASTPMTAVAWLQQKKLELRDLGPEEKQKPARDAIDAANNLIDKADGEADQVAANAAAAAAALAAAAPAAPAAPGAAAPEINTQLKKDEEALAAALENVLKAIGAGKPSGKWAAEIAKADPNAIPAITEALDAEPKKYMRKKREWPSVTQALKAEAKISIMLEKPLLFEHMFGTVVHEKQAVPAAARALASLGGDAPKKKPEEAVSGYKAQVHGGDSPFRASRSELAEQVFTASQNASATATLQREFRDKFRQEEEAEHKRLKPRNLLETEVGTIDYDTEDGSKFHVTFDPSRMVESITGTGLVLKGVGEVRGYTGEAGRKTANQKIDSSHLIADRFGGSGYAASANLISASEKYNRVDMRRVEEEIAEWIDENEIKSFSMTVRVTWDEVAGPKAVAAIKQQHPEYAEASMRKKLEDELKEFLRNSSANLKRCMSTIYTVISSDNRYRKTWPLGPDVYLGRS